jgi:hypothetical protein
MPYRFVKTGHLCLDKPCEDCHDYIWYRTVPIVVKVRKSSVLDQTITPNAIEWTHLHIDTSETNVPNTKARRIVSRQHIITLFEEMFLDILYFNFQLLRFAGRSTDAIFQNARELCPYDPSSIHSYVRRQMSVLATDCCYSCVCTAMGMNKSTLLLYYSSNDIISNYRLACLLFFSSPLATCPTTN